jgi:hypothetical protein
MLKKAISKIEEAAASLGALEAYRIDHVWARIDLHRKVFDKTLIYLDEIGTIRLASGDTSRLNPSEIGNLTRRGDKLFMYFSYLDEASNPVPAPLFPIPPDRHTDGSLPPATVAAESAPPCGPPLLPEAPEPIAAPDTGSPAALDSVPAGSSPPNAEAYKPETRPASDSSVFKQTEGEWERCETDCKPAEAEWRWAEAEYKQAEGEWRWAEGECKQAEAEWRPAEAECKRAEAESRRAEAECKRAEAESKRAEAECKRAEAEWRRAEAECKRAEAEWKRAEAECKRARIECKSAEAECRVVQEETRRADLMAEKVRSMGIDPDSL